MPVNISSNAKGILFIIAAVSCLSIMDGVTRYLTDYYNVIAINMFRYFFLFLFVISINSIDNKSVILVSKSKFRLIQIIRGTILAVEMCFAHYLFLKIGLIETHAIFASSPLIVAALSVVFLGEKVGWRRWSAILIGFIGIVIMLRPGTKVFDPLSLIALGCAFAFAIYQILTRYVSSEDSPDTSLFYTGITGFIILGSVGPFFYTSVDNAHWLWLLLVCMLGAGGHFLMINAFKHSEASILQPFTYLQLVFVSIIGVLIFNEKLESEIVMGSLIVIVAGLFTFWREYVKNQISEGIN
ncbi:DMT family transporter [Alphaproteobacteria bacterium]|nr:DMT family transporter [Alphaproteobacteria bacterium]